MIVEVAITIATLVHDDGRQYTFAPQSDGTVQVRFLASRRGSSLHTLDIEEARQLYRRLARQGFIKW